MFDQLSCVYECSNLYIWVLIKNSCMHRILPHGPSTWQKSRCLCCHKRMNKALVTQQEFNSSRCVVHGSQGCSLKRLDLVLNTVEKDAYFMKGKIIHSFKLWLDWQMFCTTFAMDLLHAQHCLSFCLGNCTECLLSQTRTKGWWKPETVC